DDVLGHVRVHAQGHGAARIAEAVERGQGHEHVIADAADVDDQTAWGFLDESALETGDHGRYARQLVPPAPGRRRAGSRSSAVAIGPLALCRWQMATAIASAASCGVGGASRPSSSFTICPTCCFSARPKPTTARLISAGVYSAIGTPAAAAASSATPRA